MLVIAWPEKKKSTLDFELMYVLIHFPCTYYLLYKGPKPSLSQDVNPFKSLYCCHVPNLIPGSATQPVAQP